MSAELERRIDELENEKRRVQDAVGRFGVALASTHDVTALLDVVLRSAMQVARARGGRLLVTDEVSGVLVEQLRAGETESAAAILDADGRVPDGVEARALQELTPVIGDDPVESLAAPLVTEASVLGLLTLVTPEDGYSSRIRCCPTICSSRTERSASPRQLRRRWVRSSWCRR